jgi:beta-mannosidase
MAYAEMTRTTEEAIELSGPWKVAQYEATDVVDRAPDIEGLEWIPATVPSSVHYDLIKAGKLGNPYASSGAAEAAAWVAASDWVFQTSFTVDQATIDSGVLALDLDGVDTFSDIWLNGRLVGRTANAYRSYQFPLASDVIRVGVNDLVIHVKAHRRMIADQAATTQAHLGTSGKLPGLFAKSLLRRYQRSFFNGAGLLNLGSEVLGIGLYKPLRLVVLPPTRVVDLHFRVDEVSPSAASATAVVTLERGESVSGELTVAATLIDSDTGQPVATRKVTTTSRTADVSLAVADPKLWWPHGYGVPNLYQLELEVSDGDTVVFRTARTVGLKKVELARKISNGRPTFQFVVNGVKVWVRGQNPIPIDYIAVHGPDAAYDRLLRLVIEYNGNMVRIWGGGGLENEHFYGTCDRLGIMVWQDFFLHSATYPDYDEAWVEEFRQESVELVARLRNHASLSLLSGGNEQEQGWDEWGWQGELDRFYGEPLIKELLPKVAAEGAPEIPYITNSPHGGSIEASPAEGEMHCWGNYINATKDPLFITETCWNIHSYSRPETLAATMGLDLEEFSELGWPGKWAERTRLPLITKYPYSDYFASRTLTQYLRSLEIEHLQADYFALKSLRLTAPSLTGIIYWSFNKGGPLFEFGCVDYLGYPLMNFYAVKRLFADVVVGIYRDIEDIRVVASNLRGEAVSAQLHLTHFDPKGVAIRTWDTDVVLEPGKTTRLAEVDSYYSKIVDRTREIVHAQLLIDGSVVSEDTLYFVPLAEVEVQSQPVTAAVAAAGKDAWGSETWTVELSSSSVQKLVQLEGNQKWLFSDNYFTLVPGHSKVVTVSLLERTSSDSPTLAVSALEVPGVQTFDLS